MPGVPCLYFCPHPSPPKMLCRLGRIVKEAASRVVNNAALAQPCGPRGRPRTGTRGWGRRDSPLLALRRVGPEKTTAKTQGQACPGGCGLLRLNSRVGGGQTTQPWVSPDTVPPTRLPRRHLSGAAAAALGPEQGCRPACVWRPTQSWVWPCSSAFAIPSLVRKSHRLAVEEWKVGNQTGSALEGVFLLLWFSHHHHVHCCFVFYYGFGFIFPSPFSANPFLPAHSLSGFFAPA